MALTNFGLLTTEQKTIWSKDLWKAARNQMFLNKFLGSDANSMVQHVTELKKDEKGTRAVITLLADLEGDGVAGDRTLEGNEEAMKTYDQVIRIDQLRHANRSEGRIADQKSIVEFRGNSKNVLAYWLAERTDQLAFLTLAGLAYTLKTNGAARVGSDFPSLEFAADVTATSARRAVKWSAASGLRTSVTGSNATSDLVIGDMPSWDMIVQLKAYAKDEFIRGIKMGDGEEVYHLFLTPQMMARLKLDANYLAAQRYAAARGRDNALFTGNIGTPVDGVILHEYRHVPNNIGTTKWGSGNTLNGGYALFCGAQALGFADIGDSTWVEKDFDYDNQHGISVSKIMGFKKPVFNSIYSGTAEDFGVLRCIVGQ
jgi:N4-gp56 family major capsid protein